VGAQRIAFYSDFRGAETLVRLSVMTAQPNEPGDAPLRSFPIDAHVFDAAQAKAFASGESVDDVVIRALQSYIDRSENSL
jgi:hypothetical protein